MFSINDNSFPCRQPDIVGDKSSLSSNIPLVSCRQPDIVGDKIDNRTKWVEFNAYK